MNINFLKAGVSSGKEIIHQIASHFEDAAAQISKQGKHVVTHSVKYMTQPPSSTGPVVQSPELIGIAGALVACVALIAIAKFVLRSRLPH